MGRRSEIATDVGAGLPLRQPDKSLKPCADLAVVGGNCSGESVDFGLILEAANPQERLARPAVRNVGVSTIARENGCFSLATFPKH